MYRYLSWAVVCLGIGLLSYSVADKADNPGWIIVGTLLFFSVGVWADGELLRESNQETTKSQNDQIDTYV